jgi:hypothetical protein
VVQVLKSASTGSPINQAPGETWRQGQKEGAMAEWMFDQSGSPCLILDGDKIRNDGGSVVGWIYGSNVYSLSGSHVGWYEGGVIYDSNNSALAFTRNCSGSLPSRPGLSGIPGMPGFSGVPGRPGLSGVPGRPGRGGWSMHNAKKYFT